MSISGTRVKEQSHLLKGLSKILTDRTSLKNKLTKILALLGEAYAPDRVYFFRLSKENNTWFASQWSEWVNEGVQPEIDNPELQHLDMTFMNEIIDALGMREVFQCIVDSNPNELLKEVLESQGVRSVLFAPVFKDNELFGFIGFDDCKLPRVWSDEDVERMSFLGNLLSLMLERDSFLQEREELDKQLRIAEESADRGEWTIDLKENVMSFEEGWCTLLNYSREEVIPSPVWFEQLIHPEDRKRVLHELDPFANIKANRLLSEYRIKTSGGAYRWLQTQATVERDSHGWPIALKASNYDITARTTYKNSLQQAEEDYKRLVETLQDVIFKINANNQLTFLNKAWQEVTGFDVFLSLEKPLLDFVHPEDREGVGTKLKAYQEGSGSLNLEFRILHAQGDFRWVNAMVRNTPEGEEKSGTLVNIHAQKQVQLALQESEERFRLMSENMTELVCMHDTQGCLTYVSPSCKNLLGYEQKDMIGLDPGDIMSGEDRERITNTLLHPMIKGNLLNDTIRMNVNKADGTPVWLETVVQPIIKNGELESLLSVSRDISTRKAAEEEMEKALLKEKELNTLRSTFISMASHEFRTPLASIKSSVDLLDMYIEEAMPSMQGALGRHLGKVRNQIDRLTDMMNDVLILGKTEAKKMPFEPVMTDVVAFCMDFLEQNFLSRADGRFVKLEVKGKRKKVPVDTGLFSHILSNILTNAFKYSAGEPNPELTISFEEAHLLIEVKDYGIGIPKEEQSQLFESFFRAKNTIQLQGTGLGLVVVKEFTQMHGGSVEVKSKQNQGTLVTIRLPLEQKKPTS